MKLLMAVNKVDKEMIEMWRDSKLGMQLLGVVHSDTFCIASDIEVYNALYDENRHGFVEVSLEVVK